MPSQRRSCGRSPLGAANFAKGERRRKATGANTQAETLDEARENLREAVGLVLEANRALAEQEFDGAKVIRERLRVPA